MGDEIASEAAAGVGVVVVVWIDIYLARESTR
jgi:hypothetical protein